MAIKIVEVREAENEEWDSIWTGAPYATYFHSRKWAELFCLYNNGKIQPSPRMVTFSDGCTALIPLTVERLVHGLAKRYYSSSAGTYGGWLSSDRLTDEHNNLLTVLMLNIGSVIWRLNPFDEQICGIDLDSLNDDETHALDLNKGFDNVFQHWSRGHKRAVQKALKIGITVRQAETIHDFEAYYAVYQDSLRRWGNNTTTKYEWDFFRELFNNHSHNEILWIASYDDKPISGALCFYSNNIVNYWHGATLEQYFTMRPVTLIMHEAIKHACQEGYAWFDFNPSGGLGGVKEFKRRFGTATLHCPVLTVQDWRLSMIETLRGLRR